MSNSRDLGTHFPARSLRCAAGLVVVAALALLASPVAVAKTPNLTGKWVNPKDRSAPPWALHASSDLHTLTGTYRGGAGHSGLYGRFSATLNGRGNAYAGSLHVDEGSLHVNGTISFEIESVNRLSVTYHQENGPGGTFTLEREEAAVRHLHVKVIEKDYDPTHATLAWNATVTICNHDPFYQYPFSFSPDAAYTTLVHEREEGAHHPAWYLPVPPTGEGRRLLRPAGHAHSCGSFSVRNRSGEKLTVKLFDAIHSMAKLTLRIEPKAQA